MLRLINKLLNRFKFALVEYDYDDEYPIVMYKLPSGFRDADHILVTEEPVEGAEATITWRKHE